MSYKKLFDVIGRKALEQDLDYVLVSGYVLAWPVRSLDGCCFYLVVSGIYVYFQHTNF